MKSLSMVIQMKAVQAVFFCCAVYYAVQGGSNFWVCEWNLQVWPFKWQPLTSRVYNLRVSWMCFSVFSCFHLFLTNLFFDIVFFLLLGFQWFCVVFISTLALVETDFTGEETVLCASCCSGERRCYLFLVKGELSGLTELKVMSGIFIWQISRYV